MGASTAVLSRATPIAEFDVPKSSPQSIIAVPLRCEGDLIYRNRWMLPDCFFSPKLTSIVGCFETSGIPFSFRGQPKQRLLRRALQGRRPEELPAVTLQ